MAGHSKFKNIMHRKGAQDAKRAKVFTKLIRELTVAARSGEEPEKNPALRTAISAARAANMPKDTMERAIERGSGGADSDNYKEIRYEGYGPGGVAIIVEALSDNRNRTASEVRSSFTKYNGSLGETNSVSFQFDRIGMVVFSADVADSEKMFEAALEAGAQDVESSEDEHEIITDPDDLAVVRDALEEQFSVSPKAAKLSWKPKILTPVDGKNAETLMKLLAVLDESDDVQDIYANYEISDEMMEQLSQS